MSKQRKSSSPKSYKCTCHRIHKNKLFTRKCKIHRHLHNNKSKALARTKKGIRTRTKTKKIYSSKKIKEYANTTLKPTMPTKTAKGISSNINKEEFINAIQKIQQCSNIEQCTEIKNYITANVCDVNSTNKDILFYLSYLPHSEQQTIYHKTMQFSKTI